MGKSGCALDSGQDLRKTLGDVLLLQDSGNYPTDLKHQLVKEIAACLNRTQGRDRDTSAMATLQDRFNINSQLEHLQAKYVGTGHADLNRFEWAVNIHRDSFASYIGHYPMMQYFAIAENESIGRVKYNLMQKMLLPCGLPPEKDEE